jgi:hypothetical protein
MELYETSYEIYMPSLLSHKQCFELEEMKHGFVECEVNGIESITLRVISDEVLSMVKAYLDNSRVKNNYVINKI